jgi:mannan polymerase II complex MNN10 subunit
MFPKRAFITFINERYKDLVERLIQSIELFSDYPIIVYSYNFEFNSTSKKVFCKNLNDPHLHSPSFINEDLQNGKLGIVDRKDYNTYYTLSRKQTIILDALNNGLEEGIFLDADGLVRENIDTSFDYLKDCDDYPLVGKGLFEYMMLYDKGNPFIGDTLEMPIMNLLGIPERSMYYVQTNFLLFNKNCKDFFEECVNVSHNINILSNNLLYAPYHDETIINVMLWKRNAKKHLPLVHFNLSDFDSLLNFYKTNTPGAINHSPWHIIPSDKNDIKFFHGCKSISELDKCLEHFKQKKNVCYKSIKNDQSFKDKKIAIVTLFDHNYSDLAKMSIKNKIEYVNKHNYDFIYFDDVIDKTRPPQWSKVKAVETILKDYDWVWWIDIDALIMEFDIMLESLIDDDYDMIFTSNKYSYLSSGSCFFKNTHISFDFLKDCYDLKLECLKDVNVNVFDHEQQSMRQLILNVDKYKSKSKLIDERCCNSFCVTENAQVLSVYPYWNSDSNIYQKGDFVIQFCGRSFSERINDFEKYEKNVNVGSKTITIIDCYATSKDKLNILRSTIEKIKKLNNDILLVTHCTIPPDILKSVTYFLYDKNNMPNEKNLYLTWWNIFEKYEIYFTHIPGITKSFGHEFPIIRSMRNAFNFANYHNYKHFYFVEFDNHFDLNEIYNIKKIKSDVIYKNKKLMFFKVITENFFDVEEKNNSYETIFFMGEVKETCSLLNDYDRIPYDIESFNKKLTWTFPFRLEHIFAKLTENTDCLLINSYFKDFFKTETKNLSSYVDIASHILPDCDNNFHIILCNQNKINVKMIITFNNKVIFDNYVFGTMLPAYKLDQIGEYIVDMYDENDTLIKTDKLLYQSENKETYRNTGYIKYK